MFASLGRAFFATSKFLSYKDIPIKNSEITKHYPQKSVPEIPKLHQQAWRADGDLPSPPILTPEHGRCIEKL